LANVIFYLPLCVEIADLHQQIRFCLKTNLEFLENAAFSLAQVSI